MCEKHVFFDSLYRKSPYRKPVEAFVRGDFDMSKTSDILEYREGRNGNKCGKKL